MLLAVKQSSLQSIRRDLHVHHFHGSCGYPNARPQRPIHYILMASFSSKSPVLAFLCLASFTFAAFSLLSELVYPVLTRFVVQESLYTLHLLSTSVLYVSKQHKSKLRAGPPTTSLSSSPERISWHIKHPPYPKRAPGLSPFRGRRRLEAALEAIDTTTLAPNG